MLERELMGLSEREVEEQKVKAWNRRAKGRGNRWRMLRDLVAACAFYPLTTTEMEDLNLVRRGITHHVTYAMVLELERAQALQAFQEERGQYWRATEHGVSLFLGSRKATPAGFVQEVLTFKNVLKSEASPEKKEA